MGARYMWWAMLRLVLLPVVRIVPAPIDASTDDQGPPDSGQMPRETDNP